MRKWFFKLIIAVFLVSGIRLAAQSEARLLRFPAIHGNQVVFTYAGDLYTVDASGGVARKLTNDVGFEMFAKFSPDGKNIAFTAQYDGNTEVYLMPSEGGVPVRLTYTATLNRDDVSDRMGPNNIVMCWRGNDKIVFRSRGIEFNDFKGQLFEVSKNGGDAAQLPLPRGGFSSFSPDLKKLAYNRNFREFRTWKRYKGGQADDVWIYDFDSKKTENITNNPAQDIFPMWAGDKIYFISDRDQRFNLFSYDVTSKETKKLTDFKEYDIKFPSLGDKAIVFENGGYIYKYDIASDKLEKITVYLQEDFAIGRNKIVDVSRQIANYEISPDGSRALMGARGDIFTVPNKYGNIRNITNTPGIHERSSKWSPDGKWIAYISDKTGEDEIYIEPQDGKGEAKQITTGGDNYKFQIFWSPDSKKIVYADRKQNLYYVDVETKNITAVSKSDYLEFRDYAWSPDSKWLVYSKPNERTMQRIWAYSLEDKKEFPVTDEWYSSDNPVFSSDGKYIIFESDRTFNPVYSQTEWNHAYQDMGKPYIVMLSKKTKSPFAPKSDEVKLKDSTAKPAKTEKQADADVSIDIDGIYDRILELPVQAAGYFNFASVGSKVFYMRAGSKDPRPKFFVYDLDQLKETELGEIGGYEISADGKKMLVSQNGAYGIIDIPAAKIELKEKLNLADMKVTLDRKAEWTQIYNECWRQMRDFLFDPGLHKVDWQKVKETYAPLVPYVNNRADLTYIIGEMIGELNIGHSYVGGGDYPKPERIKQGLLGAKFEKDDGTGYYKIVKILKGQNWNDAMRSPLTEAGVNINEGDYIIAVNGKSVKNFKSLNEALFNTAGKQVTLTVNSSAKENGGHDEVVIPIDDEQKLYYYNWVQGNIEKVNKASNGRIGYIHIPDMSPAGLNEFVKYYYPQLEKEALIIDDRGNGGGNVSPMIIERLRREPAMITITRNGKPSVEPGGTFYGPKVCLIDEYSASDGDIFPFRFKHYKLGKVIGKRSWGGVVGIRGSLPLLDGGFLNRPEFSRYDLEGTSWIMEGHGVDPDILIDNDPAQEYAGNDQQLNKAVETLLDELKTEGKKINPPPPYPDKSK
jgi:tricorn protease